MSEFVAGFSARADVAAQLLVQAFSVPAEGFAAADVRARAGARPSGPVSFAPQPVGPKHFSPADRDADPVDGWNPVDPERATEFTDPIATARAEGFAEGVAAALADRDAQDAEHARDRALVDRLAAALASDARIDREGLARGLRQTVLYLVTRLVGEVGVSGELLAGRIDAASDLLADQAESALLRVHPDDVALLDGRLPATLFAAGDPHVARGSFVLESASTIVEDGPELWLEQLAQAIDRVALPR
jgi:flagellar assembly protein FliH